ncbi:S-layer homology domain-containing protein, partial [Paenibacillus dokdonensis]
MSKKLRSTLTGLLGLGMTLSSVGTVMAAPAKDINGHWAAKQLQEWVDKGDLNGYGDGSVKPNQSITRAEFISLVNRMFGYKDIAQISFTDLPAENWAYADIAKAVSAGYIQGYENNTIRPSANVTRQEAASMISKVLDLQAGQPDSLNQYKDAKQIAAWSKDSVSAVISKNIMHGYTDGTFSPQKNLTRAEAVVLLDAALANKKLTETVTYDQAGTYGSAQEAKVIHGNVVINVPGVVLENVEIEGDLTLAAGVGSGDVTLKNVKVHGTTNVQGGGENSIHFVDSVLVNIVINKKDGTVRIVAEGSTTAETVIVQSSAKIEEDKVSGVGFTDVELSKELPANAKVVLNGTFDDVDVYAASVSVQLQRGSIENVHVDGSAQNSSIEISSGAKLAKLVLDAVTKLLGAGQIQIAVINEGAKGSSFQTKPSQVEGPAKDSIIVNTTAPSNSSSGASTGGTSNGGSTEEGTTPHPVIDRASVSTMAELQSALAAGVKDITIASELTSGTNTVTVPAGITLRDYWKIGSGNQVVVNAGAMLRWGTGTTNNLLVGKANSTANLQLANGATLTITGGASGKIASYELNGTGTVQQQAENPFVVGASEIFTITAGSTLKVAGAVDTDLATVKPVLSVDANGGKLVINGTLELLKGSRVVLGAGLSSIERTGTITNNAGIYNGSVITGVVGILDSNHNVIDFDAVSVSTMAELQSALAAGVKDITIASELSAGTNKVTVPAGVTLRDYWKIGSGNQVVVNAGAMLRWSAGTADNLLVGKANSTANLQLATGATFTITGGASGKIASYELNGTGTVQQQAENPFVVG